MAANKMGWRAGLDHHKGARSAAVKSSQGKSVR